MDWEGIRLQVLELPYLRHKAAQINARVLELHKKVDELLRAYEKEKKDVDRLVGESFSSFIFRLIGRYEDKLDKEQREEIEAKLAYDKAVSELAHYEAEHKELHGRVSTIQADEAAFKKEIERRRKIVAQADIAKYTSIEAEYAEIVARRIEVMDASNIAKRAMDAAKIATRFFEKARGWATFDVWTRGGLLTHVAKYDNIDNAEAAFNDMSNNLSRLRNELKDIHGLKISHILDREQISSCQRAVDFWFDNIFTNLSVRGKIVNNAEIVTSAMKSIEEVQKVLDARLAELEKEYDDNRQKEKKFLIGKNI
ncbi:MAG: hypothetical protein FWE33_03860 [Defluviitaleaceae bacterium]|nr:hypothetical protein [Defluviitaleaceae bacterium]